MAEICDLHARLVANLRLGMSVFLHGDLKSAQELLAQKVLFRDLERAYADSHLGRLAGNTLESIETSSLHLDLISDLKRINSHICSIAYPILEEAGVLARTRLKEPAAAHPPTTSSSARRRQEQAAHCLRIDDMALSISDICILFGRKGGRAYDGEPVTQLEHALQTAARAAESGAGPALVTAALLHDLGHLLNDQGDTPTLRGVDDLHQFAALPFLRTLFADDVLGADQAARGRQALPVRDAARLLRRAVERLQAQPRAARRHLLAGRGGRLHRAALCRRCRRRCACGTTSPRSPGRRRRRSPTSCPCSKPRNAAPADAASPAWS